jgi:hypothetical protein
MGLTFSIGMITHEPPNWHSLTEFFISTAIKTHLKERVQYEQHPMCRNPSQCAKTELKFVASRHTFYSSKRCDWVSLWACCVTRKQSAKPFPRISSAKRELEVSIDNFPTNCWSFGGRNYHSNTTNVSYINRLKFCWVWNLSNVTDSFPRNSTSTKHIWYELMTDLLVNLAKTFFLAPEAKTYFHLEHMNMTENANPWRHAHATSTQHTQHINTTTHQHRTHKRDIHKCSSTNRYVRQKRFGGMQNEKF